MTPHEALTRAEAELNRISVPAPMLQSIGMPISNALGLIQATIEWFEKVEQEQAKKQEEGKEVVEGGTD